MALERRADRPEEAARDRGRRDQHGERDPHERVRAGVGHRERALERADDRRRQARAEQDGRVGDAEERDDLAELGGRDVVGREDGRDLFGQVGRELGAVDRREAARSAKVGHGATHMVTPIMPPSARVAWVNVLAEPSR